MTQDKSSPDNKEYSVSSKTSSPAAFFDRLPAVALAKSKLSNRQPGLNRTTYLIVIGVIASGLVGFGAGWFGSGLNPVTIKPASNTLLSPQKAVITSESQLISSIAKIVGPSVVSVNVTSTSQTSVSNLFGLALPQTQTVQSAGTGIILSSDGLIITNRHVVPQGTTSVSVTLSNGTQLNDVSLIGETSPSSSLDIAFLKINNTEGQTLIPATLGNSSTVQVGDEVVAIGNALGQFQNTVTSGIISGYGRSVQASSSVGNQPTENLEDLFQTDAAINEGNSGGPLVNMNGQVIGINTAIAGNAQNIGFAIPINDVAGLIKQVEITGKFQQPYLGVYYMPITRDIAKQYDLSVDQGAWIPPSGVLGQNPIIAGGPAASAGLKAGDIITQVNGIDINQDHSLVELINQYQVGQTVHLTVIRHGKTLHIKATLAAEPTATTNG